MTHVTERCKVASLESIVVISRECKTIIKDDRQSDDDSNENNDIQPWTGSLDIPVNEIQ